MKKKLRGSDIFINTLGFVALALLVVILFVVSNQIGQIVTGLANNLN